MQAVRNFDDLECLACPPKYRELKSFYKYYTGQLEPPIPTLFSKLSSPSQVLGHVSAHLGRTGLSP